MAGITSDKTKAKSREALLEMAKAWEKEPGKINHAIAAYEEIIGGDLESKEAEEAREALLEIAKRLEKEGKKYSAFSLRYKLARGQTGLSKRPV
jgi:hypothetical protein